MNEMRVMDLAAGVTLAIVYALLAVLLLCACATTDYTDTGVGCIDDCLQIQDEADTVASKERN